MKAKRASEATSLEPIPNVGKAVAGDLRAIGIMKPADLKGKDGIALYNPGLEGNAVTRLPH